MVLMLLQYWHSYRTVMLSGLVVVIWTATVLAQNGCNSYRTAIRTAETHFNLVLSSPNYPQHYDSNMDCLWRIQTDPSSGPDYIIKVTFQDFELEDYFCKYDSLKFYDGPLPLESTLLGSYCGTLHPDVIYSWGKYLYVKFHSDSTKTYKGFGLNYTAVKKEEAYGICRPPYLGSVVSSLNGSSGTFFSPDYPVPYPESATCAWTITVPEGKRVKLTFEDFAVRKHSGTFDCLYDWGDFLEIRDSLSSTGKELKRFNCDFNAPDLPPKVYSTGRYMFVKFRSSDSTSFRREGNKGFKANFEAVDQPSPSAHVNSSGLCSPGNRNIDNLRLTGSSGTLKVPPKYPEGLRCTWLISVPEGNNVKLSFTKFDLNWHEGTCGDNVEILDGQNTFSERLEKYCAYDGPTPKGVVSNGRYMMVIFRADFRRHFGGSNQREGVEANLRAVKKSNGSAIAIGVAVGSAFLIIFGLCYAYYSRRKRALNGETLVSRIPISTNTTSAFDTTQTSSPPPEAPADNPYPALEVGNASFPTEPNLPPYPYPDEPPPPYPGMEEDPHYLHPSYQWSQSNASAQPSAPSVD